MGNISEMDGVVYEIVGKVVPFSSENDGCALAESILAPNPHPEAWFFHNEKLRVHRYKGLYD